MEYKEQPWGFEDSQIWESWDPISLHRCIFLCLWKLPLNSPVRRSVGLCKQWPVAPLVSKDLLFTPSSNWSGCWLYLLQADVLMRFQWQRNLVLNQRSWSYSPLPRLYNLVSIQGSSPPLQSLPCSLMTTVEFLGLVLWGWSSPD